MKHRESFSFDCVVKITIASKKCYRCSGMGHNATACPQVWQSTVSQMLHGEIKTTLYSHLR